VVLTTRSEKKQPRENTLNKTQNNYMQSQQPKQKNKSFQKSRIIQRTDRACLVYSQLPFTTSSQETDEACSLMPGAHMEHILK